MTDALADGLEPAPETGHHDIDRALAALELGDDVTQHPEVIGSALDAVQRALSGPAIPAGLRPRG